MGCLFNVAALRSRVFVGKIERQLAEFAVAGGGPVKSKDEMSPLDSWIHLAPGQGLALNGLVQEMWIQKAREFRKLRGDILAASFEIENTVKTKPWLRCFSQDCTLPLRGALVGLSLQFM